MTANRAIHSDEALVLATRAGEREAFDALVERHFGTVHAIAWAWLGDRDRVEDLSQEVFLRAFLHIDRLDPPEKFGVWVSQITRNLATDWRRTDQRHSRLVPLVPIDALPTDPPDVSAKGAPEMMADQEQGAALHRAVEQLPEDLREVVLLRFGAELTQTQIAERLGVSVPTVHRRLRRAMRALRGRLESVLEGASPTLRARPGAARSTLALITAAAGMSAAEKAALASSSAFTPTAALAGTSAATITVGKAVAIGLTALALVGGGIFIAQSLPPEPQSVSVSPVVTVAAPVSAEVQAISVNSSIVPTETGEEPRDVIAASAVAEPAAASPPESPAATWQSRVWGRVADENGAPIAEAVVSVIQSAKGWDNPVMITQTDFEGRYEITQEHELQDAPVNRTFFHLAAEAPARARVTRPVVVDAGAGSEAEVDLTLPAGGRLAGHVQWEGGEPVAEARVIAHTVTQMAGLFNPGSMGFGQTDATGAFEVDSLAAGSVVVAIAPEGGPFLSGGEWATGTRDAEIVLARPIGEIAGVALGTFSREPIPGTEVWISDMGVGSRLGGVRDEWRMMTDAEGRFLFRDLALGDWRVIPTASNPAQTSASLTAERPRFEMELLLPEPITVSGTVIDITTGDPVPGLPLELDSMGGWDQMRKVTTDDEGRFHVPDVMAGYQVQLNERSIPLNIYIRSTDWVFPHGGDRDLRSLATVAEAVDLRLEVTPARAVRVTALDPHGNPIPHVDVGLAPTPRSSRSLGNVDESGTGTFALSREIEQFQLYSTNSNMWPLFLSPVCDRDTTEVELRALPLTSLRVQVVDADDQPIAGVYVLPVALPSILNDPPLGAMGSNSARPQATDTDGRVTFDRLPQCEHVVLAAGSADTVSTWSHFPENYPDQSTEIDLSDAGENPTLTIRLGGKTRRGRITNRVTGEPIAGATVRWLSDLDTVAATTDSAGEFEVTGDAAQVAAGVRFEAEGYAPEDREQFAASRIYSSSPNASITYTLDPMVTLTGRIVRADGTAPSPLPLALWRPANDHWSAGWELGLSSSQDGVFTAIETGDFAWPVPNPLFDRMLRYRHPESDTPLWVMVASRDGAMATADLTWRPIPGSEIDLETLTLSAPHTVVGHILNASREAVAGAHVEWEHPHWATDFWTALGAEVFDWDAVTDDQGRFTLTGLPSGHWRLGVTPLNLPAEPFEIDLPGDERPVFTIGGQVMPEIIVRVLDERGVPFRGVAVAVKPEADVVSLTPDAHTGPNGEVRIPNTGGGRLRRIHVRLGDSAQRSWTRRDVEVAIPLHEEVFDLSAWPRVTCSVIRDGAPVVNRQISLEGDQYYANGTTDQSGRCVMPFPPDGEIHVSTSAGNGLPRVSETITLTTDTEIRLELPLQN